MSSPCPAPTPASVLDKHLTTLVNCLQNVIYFIMLVNFVETGMLAPCFVAKIVSPVEWTGLFYNMWYSMLVFAMMVQFKDTLEALLLFENAQRNRENRKDATTIIVANETGAQIQHTDNGSTTPAWPAVACYLIAKCLNEKNETKEQASTQNGEATTPPSPTEDEIKPDTKEQASTQNGEATTPPSPTEDEIKPDTEIKPASASSSARSSTDTSDACD